VRLALRLLMVESVGVEPTSKNISERLSPSAAVRYYFARPAPNRQTWSSLSRRSLTLPGAHARFSCI